MTPPSIPDYTFRSLIGEGATGRVYAVEYGGQTRMALKAFDSESINRQLISDALVKIFNRDEHPGIVDVHDFDLASPQAYMATSLHGEPYQNADGEEAFRPRTIQGLIGHLIPEDAWAYAEQIADALAFLHRQRIIHCNLHPSNVLLDSSTPPGIRLTDFSQGLVGAVTKLIPGEAVFYAAPEQIRRPELYFGGRGERWDVYAFGVLTFQLLTGNYPRLGAAIAEIKKHEEAALDVHFNYDYKVLADMIEDQAAYEWPQPAADDDESARRAIIDRCLEIKPEDRFPDLREVVLAFRALEADQLRREDHRRFAEEQLRSDKQASGLKKIAAALGILALAGLGGTAYLSQKKGGAAPAEPAAVPQVDPTALVALEERAETATTELEEMKILLGNSNNNLRESQSALDEIFSLVVTRDQDGNSEHDLPEDSRGLLLNYYEEFATQHKANPELALEVARANNNAGEIHLTLGDAEAALEHLTLAVRKINLLRGKRPDDVQLTIDAARFTSNLSEAQALGGLANVAADSANESYELWEGLYQANKTSSEATRALASSLILLGQRMLATSPSRPADTGLHVQRAKTILETLEADQEIAEEDIVALSQCDHLLGLSERAKGNLSDAIDLQIAAVDRLLDVKIANTETPRHQLYSLASYYGELADALAESGNREDSAIANAEAVKLLVDLVDLAPSNTAYHFELARRFSTKAALLRDAGKGKEARTEQLKGIDILRDILKVHPKRFDIQLEFALALADMTDLYSEAKLAQEAINSGDESVKLMGQLLNDDLDAENNDAKRNRYREVYADLQIRYAEHMERFSSKDPRLKELAVKYYERGVNQLQALINSGSTSEEHLKAIEAADARIKALGGQ